MTQTKPIKLDSRSAGRILRGTFRYKVRIYSDGKFYNWNVRTLAEARREVKWWAEDAIKPFTYEIANIVESGKYY